MKHFRPGLPPIFTGPDADQAPTPKPASPAPKIPLPVTHKGNLTVTASPLTPVEQPAPSPQQLEAQKLADEIAADQARLAALQQSEKQP